MIVGGAGTGWNVSDNVLTNVTVWAVACYTSGIDNNSFTHNTYLCQERQLPERPPGWCGPINGKEGPHHKSDNNTATCPALDNVGVASFADLSPAARAVVEGAGPRGNWRR